ncbi:ATP-binding cassette domain-containing protein [Tetragenococcus solitarius]|uniref:ABC transporter domain-containing protein n=1 Tax=Tetragenococcus solitarius TaxID=71453 RepID=A0ABP6L016_9ENTE|nr:ABC transporter ATP-binding protein [Tetragenococcus solitarius]
MEKIITLNNVSKKYKKNLLFKDVNLSIFLGQSIAITGKNGLGKSTLLKIIAGLTNPNTGTVKKERKVSFQYIPEHFPKKKFNIKQYIQLIGEVDGISEKNLEKRSKALFEEFQISGMLDTPLKLLSKGTLQKINVIQALLNPPDILILDEPLSGQDSYSQSVFIKEINKLREQKVAIVMSCHEKYLIDTISDTVWEVNDGEVISKRIDEKLWYILTFIPQKQNNMLMDACKRFCIEKREDNFVFKVPSNKVDEFINIMLKNNWLIRGMACEKI